MSFNKAVVMDLNFFYEYPDFRTPFDFTQTNDCNQTPLKLDFVSDDRLVISMTYADCYISDDFEVTLDSSLNVLNATLLTFSDNLTDNENNTTEVEQLLFYLNQNPFRDTTNLVGHFSAIIRDIQNENEFHYPYDGKFKVYSKKDRLLTSEQLRRRMELAQGFIDENGVCELPEIDPRFCQGTDSLENYLTSTVKKNITSKSPSAKFYFRFTIDKAGRVENVTVETKDNFEKSVKNRIEKKLKNSCWIPAVNFGETVKSTVYSWIEIK
jgi:hypothetical protein